MVAAPGVLANDTDPDTGDVLTVSGVDTSGTLGEVPWNADGSFTYDPNGQFEDLAVGETATDTFTYTVSDGHGGSDTASVTITISGVNDVAGRGGRCLRHGRGTRRSACRPRGCWPTTPIRTASDVLTVSSVNTSGTLGAVTWNAGRQLHLRSERAVREPGGGRDGHRHVHVHGQRRARRFGHGQRDRHH